MRLDSLVSPIGDETGRLDGRMVRPVDVFILFAQLNPHALRMLGTRLHKVLWPITSAITEVLHGLLKGHDPEFG